MKIAGYRVGSKVAGFATLVTVFVLEYFVLPRGSGALLMGLLVANRVQLGEDLEGLKKRIAELEGKKP